MADAAAVSVETKVEEKPKAAPPAAAQSKELKELLYCVTVDDIKIRVGNCLVIKRAGTLLHPVRDAQFIAAVRDAFANIPPAPIRELTARDYEMLMLRGR